MSVLSGLRPDEVAQLLDTPGAVVHAVVVADGRPRTRNLIRATVQVNKVFKAARQDENEVIRAVALGMGDRPEDPEDPESIDAIFDPDPELEAAKAAEAVVSSIALLRDRAEKADIAGYAAWVVGIATQIADATRTRKGGLFRRRISPGEQAVIDRLSAAISG